MKCKNCDNEAFTHVELCTFKCDQCSNVQKRKGRPPKGHSKAETGFVAPEPKGDTPPVEKKPRKEKKKYYGIYLPESEEKWCKVTFDREARANWYAGLLGLKDSEFSIKVA